MAQQLLDIFSQHVTIKLTPALTQAVIHLVSAYETRGTNPAAFNTYMLGKDPCVFKTSDRDDFFELFTVDNDDLRRVVMHVADEGRKVICGLSMNNLNNFVQQLITDFFNRIRVRGISAGEVRKWVSDANAVNTNFAVVSDPFNLFCSYVLHLLLTAKNLPSKLQQEAAFKVLMFLQYKFFTSLVNYRFKYRPNEDAMIATYEAMTMKFDIKAYGTWKKVMEARAATILDPKSIHYKTLINYNDDKAILYMITDIQTRIRNQINLFVEEFMKMKNAQDRIGSYSLTTSDSEGAKILVDNNECFDMMTANVCNDAMSVSRFIDEQTVRIIVGLFPALVPSTFRGLLVAFSEYAVKQSRSGQLEATKMIEGSELDVGARKLIFSIVQKSFRFCAQNDVDINRPTAVLKALKDAYSSSRVIDQNILNVKASVSYMLSEVSKITRESSLAALRLGFILYIVILALKYLK